MKFSTIAHWLLRMFVYSCMGTSAMLLMYDFKNDCWFCRTGKAGMSEPKQYIASINKGQQAYYVEMGSFLKNSLGDLGLGIKTDTNAYSYRILSPMNPIQNLQDMESSALDNRRAVSFATPKYPGLKSYIGIAGLLETSSGKTATTSSICQSQESVLFPESLPIIINSTVECPRGFNPL